MKDIAIYGFGGFGHEVACLIHHINRVKPVWNIIGYFDDAVKVGTSCKYGTVLGDKDVLNQWDQPLDVVIAVGNCTHLKAISDAIVSPNVSFPNIIAPNVFYFDEDTVSLGKGNVITFGCRLSCNIKMGDFNVLNGCVSLGHDAIIGNYNVMLPETRISGLTKVGDGNYFGSKTFISQNLKVGNCTRFGAGSVVLRNTKDGFLYMGNPAKRIII